MADLHLLVVPGLGLRAYLRFFVDALTARGVTSTVLDVPGYRWRSPSRIEPTVQGIGRVTEQAVLERPPGERIALFGHSTGAQAALLAAAALETRRAVGALALAGPTMAPTQRGLASLALAAPAAYRRDSVRELVVLPEVLRARTELLTLVRSAVRDRPEHTLGSVSGSVLLTAGEADAFAPQWWLRLLADCAHASPSVQLARLPGSHNNPFTHPHELAELVSRHLTESVAAQAGPATPRWRTARG